MKKSAKPFIIKIIFLLVVVTSMVLVSIGLRFKYEELMRKKSELNNMLKDERTKKVNLIAQYQAYSSKEKIISVAENKLGMIRRIQPKITISVNKNLIKKVNELSGLDLYPDTITRMARDIQNTNRLYLPDDKRDELEQIHHEFFK